MEKEQKQAIKELAELLHENNLSEIDYEANGVHIRIVGAHRATPNVELQSTAFSHTSAEKMVAKEISEPVIQKIENNLLSPMVGVVYLAKDPSSPDFVKVGDTVGVGQTICLIEAMKTFNPIKATKSGKIAAVLVENGSPVEYNQPLFSLE